MGARISDRTRHGFSCPPQHHGLRWKSVSAEQYAAAREDGEIRGLFELDGPGIVLFDDLDEALRERDEAGPGSDHLSHRARRASSPRGNRLSVHVEPVAGAHRQGCPASRTNRPAAAFSAPRYG